MRLLIFIFCFCFSLQLYADNSSKKFTKKLSKEANKKVERVVDDAVDSAKEEIKDRLDIDTSNNNKDAEHQEIARENAAASQASDTAKENSPVHTEEKKWWEFWK